MGKRLSMLLLFLMLALGLTSSQLAWADEVTPPPGEEVTEEEPVEPAPSAVDLTEVLAAVNEEIDAMSVTEQVKSRLRTMFQERLQEAANLGFALEQIEGLATQMMAMVTQCNLGADLPHVTACFQLMIKAMRNGFAAEEVGAMISAKLAAGVPLKTALKQTRFELKGKIPKGQTQKDKGEGQDKARGPKNKGND